MAVGLARRVAARLALDVALAGSADVLLYSTPLPSSSALVLGGLLLCREPPPRLSRVRVRVRGRLRVRLRLRVR